MISFFLRFKQSIYRRITERGYILDLVVLQCTERENEIAFGEHT